MAKVWVFSGAANLGKSSTIRLIFDDFLYLIVSKAWFKEEFVPHVLYYQADGIEIIAVLKIGRRVFGFSTYGDNKKHVANNFKIFLSYKCNFILCAARSKGESLQLVKSAAVKDFCCEAEIIKKLPSASYADGLILSKNKIHKENVCIARNFIEVNFRKLFDDKL